VSTWTTHRAIAAGKRRQNPKADISAELRDMRAARFAERIHDEIPDPDADPDADVGAWAERVAENLPPLTPSEAAAVGQLAAALTARRSGGGPRAA
jgi:hypothetical protein